MVIFLLDTNDVELSTVRMASRPFLKVSTILGPLTAPDQLSAEE
jgi:hypothetical protein